MPVLVDGAHVPGQDPLVLRDLEYDWFAGNLHKWAGAPLGAAVLSVAPEHREKTFALLTSITGTKASRVPFTGRAPGIGRLGWPPRKLGTTWKSCLVGGRPLRAYQRGGSQAVDEAFTMAFGTESITPESARTAMCSVPLPASLQGIDCLKFEHDFDQRFGLRVPMHALSDQTMVRVSIHLHTELEDIFALGEASWRCARATLREIFRRTFLGATPDLPSILIQCLWSEGGGQDLVGALLLGGASLCSWFDVEPSDEPSTTLGHDRCGVSSFEK